MQQTLDAGQMIAKSFMMNNISQTISKLEDPHWGPLFYDFHLIINKYDLGIDVYDKKWRDMDELGNAGKILLRKLVLAKLKIEHMKMNKSFRIIYMKDGDSYVRDYAKSF